MDAAHYHRQDKQKRRYHHGQAFGDDGWNEEEQRLPATCWHDCKCVPPCCVCVLCVCVVCVLCVCVWGGGHPVSRTHDPD